MEDNGKHRIQAIVTEDTYRKLEEIAKRYGVKKGAAISVLIENTWRTFDRPRE